MIDFHNHSALHDANIIQSEVFVYDKSYVSIDGQKDKAVAPVPLPPKYEIESPPDTILDANDLQSWQDLFRARRAWALQIVDACSNLSVDTQQRYDEISVYVQSFDAAIINLEVHVRGLDRKGSELSSWASSVIEQQTVLKNEWQDYLENLRLLPTTSSTIQFLTGRDTPRKRKSESLVDLVDVGEVKQAGSMLHNDSNGFSNKCDQLFTDIESLIQTTNDALSRVEKGAPRASLENSKESVQLMEDIEVIAKKVNSDYETVLGLSNEPKSASQASKWALLHTRNYLPSLMKRGAEMDDLARYSIDMRNRAAQDFFEGMQNISRLTKDLQSIEGRLATLEVGREEADALELLVWVQRLPIEYASFLAEAIRRREWTEKIKADSSTLVNEFATFQKEEEDRRRKWQKITGSAFFPDRTERKALGLEVNLQGEEEPWPHITRQDLDDFLRALQIRNAKENIIAEVSKVIAELNNPTKQQSRRIKAFKAGSMHEGALGRSALLVRGDDELIRSLQDEKSRIEVRLRGADSRVRRLEDLLHRQGQASATGNLFQLPGSSSPSVGNPSQFNVHSPAESPEILTKIEGLEADVAAERANKKDLRENLESQQKDHLLERKNLMDEISRLKAKMEEVEDDMDRILESRENIRASVDDRVRSLQDELDKLRRESSGEVQKAQGQVDFLRNDAKLQRESNEALQKQLQMSQAENNELKLRLEIATGIESEYLKSLKVVHEHLLPSMEIPVDETDLVEALTSRSGDILAEVESLKRDLAITKSDLEETQTASTNEKDEMASLSAKLEELEAEKMQLQEALGEEKAKFGALETEFDDERRQLSSLRVKMADGETGSEAMRSRVEEEEHKVATLSEELAIKNSQLGSLEEELHSVKEKLQDAHNVSADLSDLFEGRSSRAKNLTQHLYTQNNRLSRLLERLSFSVTRQGDSTIIQKVPRTERNANDSSDPGSSMRRSSGTEVLKKAMADSSDLELLHWMNTEDSKVEAEKYQAFMDSIGNFDIEAFAEAITKQVLNLEHTARKYRKDARAYRDKSHVAQKEAHEKIAFKHFKEGDLALFLPTRSQANGAWAAFNVGAPHYFLREQDSHKLRTREWLLARISKVEERVVDLSRSVSSTQNILNASDQRSLNSTGGESFEDDNPFDLSDGLRWYLIDAAEEKPGAPTTPGLGKSTVASSHESATGSVARRSKKSTSGGLVEGVSKTLTKSLDSRRSSSNSKRVPSLISRPGSLIEGQVGPSSVPSINPSPGPSSTTTGQLTGQEVRENLVKDVDTLLGP